MAADPYFPRLPDDYEATRATLHAYAHGVGAIPRAHALADPKWWHISLTVRPDGLVTQPVALPGGGSAFLRMDPREHAVVLESSDGTRRRYPMSDGLTGTEFADRIIEGASELGLAGDYARAKFESDEPREYDPAAASAIFRVLVATERALSEHRAGLIEAGELVGPIQLWPHGFDLAVEWFGTRTEEYEGEQLPSQINLGLYLAGRPYFYSNPWPFDAEKLTGTELPSGAAWFTESWQGSILYYDQIAGEPDGKQKLLAYAAAVHETAKPLLMA